MAGDNAYRNSEKIKRRKFINDIICKGKCTDCGISNPLLLQFHHIQPRHPKILKIKDMVQQIRSWEFINTELAKCVIVCANCHILRHHAEQSGYFATGVSIEQ
jgi:hypothetical protein